MFILFFEIPMNIDISENIFFWQRFFSESVLLFLVLF